MRFAQRVIGMGVAFGLIGAALVGVEAQTRPAVSGASEPGVVGDPLSVLSLVPAPQVSMPELSVPKGDFSGMPGVGFGGESVDGSLRLPWRLGVIRPNGDPVRRSKEKNVRRGKDLGSTLAMGDEDRAAYPVPVLAVPADAPKSEPKPGDGRKVRHDPNAWADEDVSVELPEKRTANSKTYANPDGSRTAAVFPGAVHAKTRAGWVDVDPTVRKKGTSIVSDGGSFTSTMSAASASGSMVVLDLADGLGSVSFSMVGASNAKPVERQDTVSWSEVKPGVDFAVRQSAGSLIALAFQNTTAASSALFVDDLRLTTNPTGGGTTTTVAGTTTTVAGTTTTTTVAGGGSIAPGTCVNTATAGGTLMFGDVFAAGWADGSWNTPGTISAAGGVGGTAAMTATRAQWEALAAGSGNVPAGGDVISFSYKGTGVWQLSGLVGPTGVGSFALPQQPGRSKRCRVG